MIALSTSCAQAAENSPSTVSYPALARVYRDMAAGCRVRVAFLGGSITWGACATDPRKASYRALVSAQLESQFPEARLRFVDAAIGGHPRNPRRWMAEVLPENRASG